MPQFTSVPFEGIIDQIVNTVRPRDLSVLVLVVLNGVWERASTNPDEAQAALGYFTWRIDEQFSRSAARASIFDYANGIDAAYGVFLSDVNAIARTQRVRVERRPALLAEMYRAHAMLVAIATENSATVPTGFDPSAPISRLRELTMAILGAPRSWVVDRSLQLPQVRVEPRIFLERPQDLSMLPVLAVGPPVARGDSSPRASINLLTWNMQGAQSGNEASWTALSGFLRSNDMHVLTIQEAGEPPASAVIQDDVEVFDQFGQRWVVHMYDWNVGTSSRPQHFTIVFLHVRQRVNLAVVVSQRSTRFAISGVRVIADDTQQRIRPALGVTMRDEHDGDRSDITFYTVHTISGGGVNAPRLLRQIEMRTPEPYVVGGDFNRDPRPDHDGGPWLLPSRLATTVLANGNTQPSNDPRSMLNYTIVDRPAEPPAVGRVRTDPFASHSDHLAVVFVIVFFRAAIPAHNTKIEDE
ncbi:hypothetical protein [Mycobacteroides abscessus]|uniref:hypothetical protein n=1 Tax=Mycobacteroides abscessus TaxID=36809 RepID=UPI001300143B|nr:hypothetical protein [Mycobacteroides abscessus]